MKADYELRDADIIQVHDERYEWATEPMQPSMIERTDEHGKYYEPVRGELRIERYFTAALQGLLANPNITAKNLDPIGITTLAWALAAEAVNNAPGA
jgi:hypothetical protein